ncbi:hypothetical protein EB118_20605 [bacterium]|nr:hypothetical protein [bacterium]
MNIVMGIQLINGSDLIGSIEKQPDYYVIKDPAQVAVVPSSSTGSMGVALMPWIPYSDNKEFTIKSNMVVTEFTPAVDLINRYNSMFGSGIQIASSGTLR